MCSSTEGTCYIDSGSLELHMHSKSSGIQTESLSSTAPPSSKKNVTSALGSTTKHVTQANTKTHVTAAHPEVQNKS